MTDALTATRGRGIRVRPSRLRRLPPAAAHVPDTPPLSDLPARFPGLVHDRDDIVQTLVTP